MTDTRDKYVDISSLHTDDLIYLCRRFRDISVKFRLFHNQLKTCGTFKEIV